MRAFFLISVFTLVWTNIFGQTEYQAKDHIRKGNKLYKNEAYSDAELEYRKAMELEKNKVAAKYNFANSLYKSKKYKEAATNYEELKNNPDLSLEEKAKVLHNLGNSYAKQEDWEKSYKAYKEALKLNPNDEETRYNLIFAQKHLKKSQQQQNQEQNQNQDQQNKDGKKEQNKQESQQDKQGEDKKEQSQENQEQQKQSGEEKDKQEKQGQQNEGKESDEKKGEEKPAMSMQEAKQLLKAIEEKDKKTAEKVEVKKAKANRVKVEKDW